MELLESFVEEVRRDAALWRALERSVGGDFSPPSGFVAQKEETHISWLLLSANCVLKLKKAVDLGFLCFTAREQRIADCCAEVRLNRRFSAAVYVGVAVLRQKKEGLEVQVLQEEGEWRELHTQSDVECGVVMRRLPSDRWLNVLLERNDESVTEEAVRKLARLIAQFHSGCQAGERPLQHGCLTKVCFNAEENFEQTRCFFKRTLTEGQFALVAAFSRHSLSASERTFREREEAGMIRDCHGDLHSAQMCLTRDGQWHIIDCIEFNDRFRCSDLAADVAFCAMDFDHFGRPDLSACLIDSYKAETKDTGLDAVLPYYKVYRAYTRGKVESLRLTTSHADDKESERVVRHAASYFELAASYVRTLYEVPPMLIAFGGLMGCGKSRTARILCSALRCSDSFFQNDVIRHEERAKRGEAHLSQRRHQFGDGDYTMEGRRAVYRVMHERAQQALQRGSIAVVEASYSAAEFRDMAREVARSANVPFVMFVVRCAEDEALQRLQRRQAEGNDASEGRADLLQQQREAFEELGKEEVHVVLDSTKRCAAEVAAAALQHLYSKTQQ